ncbi:uncharacterized protein TRIREDRAFT_120311 [Trichoderma reesei QM6a]|uniref:Predicted protein n=2 Tax=Hypocrea jecorina TaxID=51453 RepID=G0RB66_HYPJQ|nr:uncharacterized protein TRIREDRAFT_120311 [Trichoderma reesei QM6a]EGR51019.1 predicted protein [Trichoderma reesei QM6a]ETS04886.1 hypothetical protein M419DRAFT_108330 [Trichoderma reesei RUT C-30]
MALQSVQVRPHETADVNELETFIESLINQTVPSTFSKVPVFSFKTTEENVNKIREKFGDHVIIDIVN